jgi:hypothetical protein
MMDETELPRGKGGDEPELPRGKGGDEPESLLQLCYH